MTRERLPARRQGFTENLIHRKGEENEIKFAATFNWQEHGRLREVFCLAAKEGSDMRTMLHHACIITSVALQHGATMDKIAHALGEDDTSRKPGSIIGLIVRAGVVIDQQRPWTMAPRLKPSRHQQPYATRTAPSAGWAGASNRITA